MHYNFLTKFTFLQSYKIHSHESDSPCFVSPRTNTKRTSIMFINNLFHLKEGEFEYIDKGFDISYGGKKALFLRVKKLTRNNTMIIFPLRGKPLKSSKELSSATYYPLPENLDQYKHVNVEGTENKNIWPLKLKETLKTG